MEKDLQELKQLVAKGFDHIGERFERLEGRMEEGFAEARQERVALAQSIGNLQEDMRDVKTRVRNIEETLEREQAFTSDVRDQHEERITRLEDHAGLSPLAVK